MGLPFVRRPQGVVGCWPLLDRPPCGWSTGFFAIPLTTGLNPQCLTKPAFATRTSECPELEVEPRDAKHSSLSHMLQPDLNFNNTLEDSFFNIVAYVPPARHSFAPWPGANSIL